MGKFLLLLFAALTSSLLPAQTAEQYFFSHYDSQNGLLSNQVNAVLQDGDGFLWIASTDGLQRFDGVRFKNFLPIDNDPYSIPGKNIIQLLKEDPYHFWILTDDYQLGLFSTKTFRFKAATISASDPTSTRIAPHLVKDADGSVMFNYAAKEFLTYNEEKNEFSAAYNFLPLEGISISDVKQRPGTRQYWIGTENGLIIYDRDTKKITNPGNNYLHEPMIEALAGLRFPADFLFDSKGRFWYNSWEPVPLVSCYQINTGKVILDRYGFKPELKSYYEIKGCIEQSDGTIWVRGLKLFARYREKENDFVLVENGFQREQGIAYELVTQLFEDREKNIWVTTNNKGIYRYNPSRQKFTNLPHINLRNQQKGNGSVMSFVLTKDGNLLSGSWDDGLYMYDKQLHEIPLTYPVLQANRFIAGWSMCASKDSRTIWIGSQPGLWAFDQDAGTMKMYNPPQLENHTIRQVVEDSLGNLWLGLQSFGVFKWNAADVKARNVSAIKKIDAVDNVTVNKLLVDRRGNIWVATGMAGCWNLGAVNNKVLLHIHAKATDSTSVMGNAISAVLDYSADTMLFMSPTNIFSYNLSTGNVDKIGANASLSGYISSAIKDANGFVWLSTTSGIYRLNVGRQIFNRYDITDGIGDVQFTLSSNFEMPDNRLLFGSSEIVAFNPIAIEPKQQHESIRITDFIVQNKSLLVDSISKLKELELEPGNNSVVVEFSTLGLYPGHTVIKYKLEGLDKEWQYADNSYRAVYSYLPAGSYTLLLTSENADGEVSDKATRLNFIIKAHFWQTWWFYGILILLAAVLLYWFDSERMRRKRDLQMMRENIAGNLHEEINTTLGNINILSAMAKRKADKDPTKSKDYIEQIHAKSGYMMMAMDDMLWSIDPNNDSLQKTLERIREFTEALENEKGIETELWVDQQVSKLSLNMQLRYEAFQLLKEVLNSLDDNGKCKVHVGIESGKLEFIIQYENEEGGMTGISCLMQKLDLQKRLDAAKAEINVQVHKRSGLVELRIPLN